MDGMGTERRTSTGMKKSIKLVLALAASLAAIAVGQRQQNEQKQKDTRTQGAQMEGHEPEAEAWFI
jgi:uncharacterized protein HemX